MSSTSSTGRQHAQVIPGLGWNFMFVGATTMLTMIRPSTECTKARGLNELAARLTMFTSSAASGTLLSTGGSTDLKLMALPAVMAVAAGVVLVWRRLAARVAA